MAVKRARGSLNVLEAAKHRIKNVFSNELKVYLSTSGGKDSICMADLVYQMILSGEINPKQLTVIFIDEEAIYDCCIELTKQWRTRFLTVGAKFRWYCLPLKQVCCLNQLTNDESWITWEPGKEKTWVRQPPPFAIRESAYITKAGEMNYQTYLAKVTKDGIMLSGVRAAESVQRLQYMSTLNLGKKGITKTNTIYPIYDWKDNDVWLYIKEHHLDIPEAYLWLYQSGVKRNSLRISNFFGSDSLAGLKHVAETDPELWARIEQREPNAYMTMLYWDSEMYKRSSRKRQQLERNEPPKDYKALCKKILFDEPERHFTNKTTRGVAKQYRTLFVKCDGMAQQRDYKKIYEALIAGDPKLRSLRAIYQNIFSAYAEYAKQFRSKGGDTNG